MTQIIQNQASINDKQQQTKNQEPTDTRIMPFIIERYNKNSEDRNRQRTFKKPKLGVRRLTDEKKLVPLQIDIPIDETTIIKERFDWDLGKENVAPSQFVQQLSKCLFLDKATCQKLKLQILSQIVEHIKNHTKRKKQQEKQFAQEPFIRQLPMRFNNNEYIDQDPQKQENQKKKLSRQRRIEVMKRYPAPAYNPNQNKYFKEKKICKNCKNENITPGFECKSCKIPFYLLDILNLQDKRVKLSVKYYQKIATKIPLLMYQAKQKQLEKQDFSSFYQIYTKIKNIFEKSNEISKQNLNQIKYIMEKYHEYFLHGNMDFNDQNIIFEKDIKKELPEDENRVPRKRGRPRKIKILNSQELNTNNNNEQNSNISDSSSSSQDKQKQQDQIRQ